MQARVYYRRNKPDVHEDIMLADGQLEIQEVSQMMPVWWWFDLVILAHGTDDSCIKKISNLS